MYYLNAGEYIYTRIKIMKYQVSILFVRKTSLAFGMFLPHGELNEHVCNGHKDHLDSKRETRSRKQWGYCLSHYAMNMLVWPI